MLTFHDALAALSLDYLETSALTIGTSLPFHPRSFRFKKTLYESIRFAGTINRHCETTWIGNPLICLLQVIRVPAALVEVEARPHTHPLVFLLLCVCFF